MKVAIVAPPWVPIPPPAYGGTELAIDLLARGLQRAGHEVLVFTVTDSTCMVPRVATRPSSAPHDMGLAVDELIHVMDAYDHLDGYDLVHDHTLVGPLYGDALGLRPVVTTNHGPFDGRLAPVYRRICRRVPVIAISHDQASRAGRITIDAVIHHGLDVAEFPTGTGGGGYFLVLSRMAPDKGIHRAVQLARKAGVRLLIAAKMREPAERQYFEEAVAPWLDHDRVYIGEVTREEKVALLGEATALINPIQWPEPFGLAMLEALACGTPVVGTPEGATPEIVTDGVTGYLGSSDAELLAGIRYAERLDRGLCRHSVHAQFSVERMVAQHVKLYERALTGELARRPLRSAPTRTRVMPTVMPTAIPTVKNGQLADELTG